MIEENIIVVDTENATPTGRPNPDKDILKYVGIRLPNGTKHVFQHPQQMHKCQQIMDRYRYIVGHNWFGYDKPLMERHGYKFQKKVHLDTLEIIKKRAKPMMGIDFSRGQLGLRSLCKYFKLEHQKGDFDYSKLNRPFLTPQEYQDLRTYLFGDLDSTYELFEYLYDFFYGFKELVSDKDRMSFKWLTSSSGSTAYKVICNLAGLPEEYSDATGDRYPGSFVSAPTEDFVSGDIYCFDFTSLYPHMFMGGNLYSPTSDGFGWNGSDIYKVKGTYGRKMGVIERVIKQLFESRIEDKRKMKQYPKDSEEYKLLDKKQYSKKITINTCYGISGSPVFKSVYNRTTASDCTAMAKQSILHARDVLQSHGYRCVYTDSVAGESRLTIKINNEIQYMTFTEMWDFLEQTNNIVYNNGKEYVYQNEEIQSLTMNDSLEIEWQPIEYIMRHKNTKQCYEIQHNKNNKLVVTEDHSIMNIEHGTHKFKTIKPEALKSVVLNSGITKKHSITKINHAAEMLGYWLGNGSYSGDYYINFACGKDTEEFKNKCLSHVVELKDRPMKPSSKGDITVSHKDLRFWMESTGFVGNSKTKRIPKYVFYQGLDYKLSFIRGMFSADGTVLNNRIIRYTTVNKDLANDLKLLLESIGIGSSIITESKTNTYNGKDSGTFSNHVKISQLNNKYFKDNIGFIFDRKTEKVTNFSRKKYSHSNTRVSMVNYDGYVYDIEVGGTHRFFANDILVHNTDSVYVLDHKNDFKELEALCSAITRKQISNLNIPIESHNFEFEDKIKRMYFFRNDQGQFVKKHYMYVKDDDTVVVKGLKPVRGDCSAVAKEVFEKYIKEDIKNGRESQYYSIDEIRSKIEDVARSNPDVLTKRFRVYNPESYKSQTAIQVIIGKELGEGEHYLVPNKFIGYGKSTKYATPQKLKEAFGDNWLDAVLIDRFVSDLSEFIKPQERKQIGKRKRKERLLTSF